MANYMKDVAEELQIPLDHPFKLLEGGNRIYKLTPLGVFEWGCYRHDGWSEENHLLKKLLIGNREIESLLPNKGDTYYTVFWNEFYPSPKVFKCTWEENCEDLSRFKESNFFLSEKEALDNKTATYNRLKGDNMNEPYESYY